MGCGRGTDHDRIDGKPDGTGRVDDPGFGQAQPGVPGGGVDDKDERVAGKVRESRMRGDRRRQAGAQPAVQRIEPEGTAHGITSRVGHQRIERGARIG